ncbi:multisite-specific tRNA:(cytosine-C5)-methyltransferase [Cryptococcus wingfieldii CBS 7118]|uniref:Multisite-specific tRNA:(Cytosine-C5)-methyltransferase n=1 Tax=Cryptococcus wingfieldii CBS 7118 TaxID=1295528 RepID=A0A1E3INT4_9TREE|nr:multisite-specific tRNA:(cytosine-C5)-methyltransferase [Cryptococcus wingfieldii CBS 7118]ODN90270.1 multisite-specific tRNA:(cytosine-C5)-methyltransferase [Cryptococcus wingfieldii CBS 7118]
MGRPRGGKKNGRGGRGGSKAGHRDDPSNSGRGDWVNLTSAEKSNKAFETYYQEMNIMTPEEWPQFMETVKQELPLTFRVTGSRAHAETINDIIKTVYVPKMHNVEFEGTVYDPPAQISWYPAGLGWTVSAPKRVVRKTEPFKNFQRFLVGETEVGNLSRQEAVSMIPPLFLDVESHHHCLDMCAAPGSKTAQIIEALNPHHTTSTGLLIANDSDYKRTHMLVHQTGRMPSKGLMVTNFDASIFPQIKLGDNQKLLFDRILADVPCSGDGTMRKNIEIWGKWGVADGNSLHPLQLRILERAMALLKPGGRLVYSTCSLNPAEDESVLCAALNNNPSFSLVDVSSQLPELKRRPGMNKWKVATQPGGKDGELVWYETFEGYQEALESGKEKERGEKGKTLPRSLWPPANVEDIHLERSMRLLPHDQNTGGFFVAVIERAAGASSGSAAASTSLKREASPSLQQADTKRPREDAPVADAPAPATAAAVEEKKKEAPAKKEKRDVTFKEDPYSYVDPEHDEVKAILARFQFKDTFPKNHLLVRNEYGTPHRTMYLTNEIVKQILLNNDYTRLRIISAGVKSFTRQDSKESKNTDISCKWRPPVDGVLELLPHLGDGILVRATLDELRNLLVDHYPAIDRFRPEWKAEIEGRESGAGVVVFEPGTVEADEERKLPGGELRLPLYLPIWKAKISMSLMIDKREKSILSLRTFGQDICKPPPVYPAPAASTSTDNATATDAAAVEEVKEGGDVQVAGAVGIALAAEGEAQ